MERFEICSKISAEFKKQIKIFHVFDDFKGYNVLYITSDDKVFGFGSNCFGCCGLGHNSVVNEPQIIPELYHKNVKHFFIGNSFVLAHSCDNRVYGWGNNEFGQLGRVYCSEENEYLKPEIICFSDETVIQISCGSAHTLVLTKEERVFAWGANNYGQIGCGKGSGEKITEPTKIEMFDKIKIKSIYCSYRQSFALTTDGWVYSWGDNEWCDLGHEIDRNECVFTPKLIDISHIISVCISSNNTYFLTNEGIVYFCGYFKDENKLELFQKIPKKFNIETRLYSLHNCPYYRNDWTVGTALSHNFIYELVWNNIYETKYKTLFEFYCCEYKITYKTIEINSDYYFDGNDLSDLKHLNKVSNNGYLFDDMFEELEKLGSGGFGVVYKVKDKYSGQYFAMKKIVYESKEENKRISAKVQERITISGSLFKETNTMAKCISDFVVKYFNSWIENNVFYIQMEFCSDNLQNVIQKKKDIFKRTTNPMSIYEYLVSCELFKELLECVQYLHESKPPIMHRDLKPANILVNYKPVNSRFLKLCDFGLADFDEITISLHTSNQGSLKYMAPERWSNEGKSRYNKNVDIFSLGIIAQDIFDYDINMSTTINPKLMAKFKNLVAIISRMIAAKFNERPPCSQILENSNWSLSSVDQEGLDFSTDDLIEAENKSQIFLKTYLDFHLDRLKNSRRPSNLVKGLKKFFSK